MQKILVVEDDDFIRGMICTVLKKHGFEVIEAKNGVDGVDKALHEKPNIVLTDMLMPDKEGIETILEIRSASPDIKIIAMSGGGKTKNMNFLDMAKKVGAEKILSKPFKPSALLNAISEIT